MQQPRRSVFDPQRRAVSIALPFAGLGLPALPLYAQEARPKLDVPYVPTPMEVVNKMLDMGKVGKNDVLYDLGCGDGRIVITAAKERGARGVGVDIDPQRIAEANENAQKAGVQDRVQFRQGDLFKADFSPATVVTLYLLPDINKKLRPQLWRQLKVGTRVVSHAFDMGDEWPPERTERVDFKTIYSWTIKQEHKKAAA
jgi:ubiquinone/menaquinone biosynthesis C-methylase UbiE